MRTCSTFDISHTATELLIRQQVRVSYTHSARGRAVSQEILIKCVTTASHLPFRLRWDFLGLGIAHLLKLELDCLLKFAYRYVHVILSLPVQYRLYLPQRPWHAMTIEGVFTIESYPVKKMCTRHMPPLTIHKRMKKCHILTLYRRIHVRTV